MIFNWFLSKNAEFPNVMWKIPHFFQIHLVLSVNNFI